MTEFEIKEVFESPHKLELISEEKIPSLYSHSSFTNSICSHSTIDLDELDQTISIVNDSSCHEKRETYEPLRNNFLSERLAEQTSVKRIEVETPEPSIKPIKQTYPPFSKSVSLHDVSNILPLNVTTKSNTVSCETINSQSLSSTTKSKDSGFQRSLSCLSLTSGKRSYDHVQSKVKAYIKNIKESEALNKKNKLLQKQEKINELVVIEIDTEDVGEKDDLIKKIQELKHELHEKSLYIDAQQRNYNNLLLKFAEAKDIIDKLRVQSMSFSYSDDNNSKNKFPSFDKTNFDSLYSKISQKFDQMGSCIAEDESSGRDCLESANTTSEIVRDNFKPHTHSSPYEKSLSPVKKMFSSSSCLGKSYKPLSNPKKISPELGRPQEPRSNINQTPANNCDAIDCVKLNNHSNLLRRQSMNIDLPNDDPFDKVKKWQASLPSINLLGSHSSSDCEDFERGLTNNPEHCHPSRVEENSSDLLVKTRENESEISSILSRELQNKCIITDVNVESEPKRLSFKNNREVSTTSKNETLRNTLVSSKIIWSNREKPLFINNKCSGSKSLHLLPPKKLNQVQEPVSNCMKREHSVEVMFSSVGFEDGNTNLVPLCSREPSVSGDDSSPLPKSSSISNCRINQMHDDSDSSEGSSSISSSVLGSDSLLSVGSPKRVKRRLVLCEGKSTIKVPKITKSKSSQTTFTLREPKFNFTPPHSENIKSQMNNRVSSKKKSINYETWFKHRGSNNVKSCLINTESSQRKAWNERNNANFYVCKDFSFTKSTTLMECIKDMEGMVSKGACVIRSVVERNQTLC